MKKRITQDNRIPNLVVTPLKGVSLEEILKYQPILDMIRQETPKGILRAIRDNKPTATLIEINHTGYCIEVPHKFWRNALSACLKHFTEEEDFEKCIEIQQVQEALEEYDKIPTTMRNKKPKHRRNGYE